MCPNSIAGCLWEGELQKVTEHQSKCSKEKVPCSYGIIGCEERMFREKQKKHEEENRDAHLDYSMKMVVALTRKVEELQERLEQQEIVLCKLKNEVKK